MIIDNLKQALATMPPSQQVFVIAAFLVVVALAGGSLALEHFRNRQAHRRANLLSYVTPEEQRALKLLAAKHQLQVSSPVPDTKEITTQYNLHRKVELGSQLVTQVSVSGDIRPVYRRQWKNITALQDVGLSLVPKTLFRQIEILYALQKQASKTA